VEVERVVAGAPCGCALISSICDLVGLAVDAGLHDVVLANSAVVDRNVCQNKPHNPNLPHDQSETAFHFLISNLFADEDSTIIFIDFNT
jgi:hypothetical protein